MGSFSYIIKKRKISIKDENSFDQIWGTSPTHFRLPLLRSNFQPATKSAAIIFFIFMSVIITITITAIILVINGIMITILKWYQTCAVYGWISEVLCLVIQRNSILKPTQPITELSLQIDLLWNLPSLVLNILSLIILARSERDNSKIFSR